MERLGLCCKGIGHDKNVEPEPKEKIIFPDKTESCHKASHASVIPAKRKCVKKMMCCCLIHCICDKCLNTKTKTKTDTKAFCGAGLGFGIDIAGYGMESYPSLLSVMYYMIFQEVKLFSNQEDAGVVPRLDHRFSFC
ncbi:hypothetical protein E2542_SST02971 [Spatholobus suberectus]|nr:hypothetical protein E2542_SST02971 [Spatholobus suberectus]